MQNILDFLSEAWFLILTVVIIIGGVVYRHVTKQPFKGDIPSIGYFDDMPNSVYPSKINENKPSGSVDQNSED